MVVYYGDEANSSDSKAKRGIIVGRIGFASKPDERGRVEVGYEVDPMYRQRGHARAALKIMIEVARAIEGVDVLVACVVEENWISRKVVEGEGLKFVRQEVHPRRGLENRFELDLSN